ncbi:MAG: hypothetical protein FJZ90_04475 [Chloroflexi bacterium]|nr:hypothetical protein [Chloroflexota bacterium]
MWRNERLAVLAIAVLGVALLALGCTLRPGKSPERLTYHLPTTLTIAVGEAMPGTEIRYQRMSDRGAHVLIRGQEALKRKGDSLDWRGQPLPGVDVDLRLRVLWFDEQELRVAGTAKVVIQGAQPRLAVIATSSPLHYTGPVVYSLAPGATIPGSAIAFDGRTDEGAKLGGIEGYPYRQIGDSIFWEGTLREGVYVRLELRVLQYDDKGLRVGGLAKLWLGH